MFKPGQYIIVDHQHATGPFNSRDEALDWLAAPHRVGCTYFLVSLYEPAAEGTAQIAYTCGSVVAWNLEI